jgi:hypothetical protein
MDPAIPVSDDIPELTVIDPKAVSDIKRLRTSRHTSDSWLKMSSFFQSRDVSLQRVFFTSDRFVITFQSRDISLAPVCYSLISISHQLHIYMIIITASMPPVDL